MTEKRFTKYVPDSYGYTYITTIIDSEKNKQTGNIDEIVDMLNELADENEQLKKEIESWKKHCITHGIAVPITWGDKND